MRIVQLDPPLWLETPKGVGLAHLVTWASLEHSLYWTVFDEATGRDLDLARTSMCVP